MFLPLIVLIILGCVYAGSLKSPQSRLTAVVVILTLILIICYIQMISKNKELFAGFTGYAPVKYVMHNAGSDKSAGCDGYNYGDINNQIGPLGSYDGIRLKSEIATKPLISDVTIFNNVGDGYILKDSMNSESYPLIDGQKGSPRSMFVLKNNAVSWDCCPSTFGAGMNGCVCPSKEQIAMFSGRNGNKTRPVEYPEM